MIADNPNYLPPKRKSVIARVMHPDKFNEWATDRWSEYHRAGLVDQNAPNYEPSKAIEEFVKDFQEKFPGGVRVIK